ncbi:NAD-dependent epimerase/dehydratase family protein [Saccharothrix syringae]|uniref:NAD-dependent epimerase/dehydratase family protein n=1 Tax=Saccharothrix syringae TaxID=103733 RepID=A0A5Q0GX08_SACSY|nr:NAD-dependent epimerase/dehydratase family protein [Saccharothrix syringae]QFZ18064.1 NAD-dependent epimerase/dehydratase family protein [Saccharothrix syringae]
MRIVVTGATGNLGTALLRRLADEPGVEVRGVTRRTPEPRDAYRGVEWRTVDLGRDGAEEPLTEVFRDADAVVHLAWLIQPSHDERALYKTNVAGSDRVFTAAAAAGVPHLVHMSSVGAYSPAAKDHTVDESWPTDGVSTSYYSRHKAAVEHLLDQVRREHPQLKVTRVRPGLVLQAEAAAEIKRYFLGRLVPHGLFKLRIPVLPLPDSLVLQFVHADDVADAVARIALGGHEGAFNLVADPVVTPEVLAEVMGARRVPLPPTALRAAARISWHLRLQPTSHGWVDLALTAPLLDAGRARAELGWEPRHDAREALRELLGGLGRKEGLRPSPPLKP